MQITGPTQIVFATGESQQSLALAATGASGTVQYTVTEVPAQTVAVRKSAGASPLAVGAVLTAAEAAALVVTRSGTVSYGPTVTAASIAGVRSRVYATGAAAPAFAAGDAAAVNAAKAGTFAVPNFPAGGAGTVTVDLLFDLGTPTSVGKMLDTVLHFGYANSLCDLWSGVTARGLASTDGSAVTQLAALAKAGSGNYVKNENTLSGTFTGAPSARWIGVRLEGVTPSVYPVVFKALGVQAATTTYTAMPSPVHFAVSAQDSGGTPSAAHRVAIGDSSTNFGTPTGNPVVYGDPGTRFPLGIVLPQPAAASYQLNVPAGLSLVEQVTGPTTVSSGSEFTATNATGPFAPAQTSGGATTQPLTITGTGKSHDGTHLVLSAGTYLDTPALGLTFPTTSDQATTQAPKALRLNFTGIFPAGSHPLASVYVWSVGGLSLWSYWQAGRVFARIERNGQYQDLYSDAAFSNTAQEDVSVRYNDTPGGTGTIAFFRGGVQVGATQVTNFKLRIPPEAPLECNIQGGNSSNSGPIKVRKVGLVVDLPSQGVSYSPVASGTISAAKLQSLYVDATAVSSPQPAKTVTYQGTGEPLRSLDVVVGPVPASAGGNPVVYGDPGTRFPLGIALRQPAASSYQLTVPGGLSLVEQVTTQVTVAAGSDYEIANATGPFAPVQSAGGATTKSLTITGSGKSHDGTHLSLAAGTYLSSTALGLAFPTTSDPATTQAPTAIRLNFTGIFPAGSHPLASVYTYGVGGISLWSYWQAGRVFARIERNGQYQDLYSDAAFSNTAQEDVSLRYTDTPGGTGSIAFLRAGVQVGAAQTTSFKLRLGSDAPLECNVLGGNTGNSGAIKVRKVGLVVDLPSEAVSYSPVSSGSVTAAKLQSLYVDATAVSSAQPAKTVTYQATGGPVQSLDVVVGPMAVAAGAAYRAVLEDWSSGAAVSHPNVLVMTKPARQNCRFEDTDLFEWQTPWTECLPQGPVPAINGIAYYCEAIRCGSYVQFQFGYDWTAATMPNNPFGDPTGKESYMVPHKWRIEDSSGALIARIERPDGGPLNGTDIPRIFSGSYDGRGSAITNATDKWYPHGTVRSAVIWRSGLPPAYPQGTINSRHPRYDVTVPYAMHTDSSANGGDMRLWGTGQANGFGNTRVMPWLPTNYAALVPTAGQTQDPYKASLYWPTSVGAVASTWLKYTPFNQAGRSPMTGPGGTRDDRAAIAEPVAQYMYNVAATRPHDGVPFSSIAIDYLTSYASDPYHCFEGGRCVPLYKGAKANRTLTLRNGYYGYGEGSIPPERAYYIQGGRPYELGLSEYNQRTQFYVPQKGTASDKPTFGTNQIDAAHAHQYPHWGSLLWATPEFAFLGHKLWDQTRLYGNLIINEPDAVRWADREGAWHFLHAVLAWKTASANSDRLYSRAEVIEFVRKDFEAFSDTHKAGFDNPPANVLTNGQIDTKKAVYAGSKLFGVMYPVNDYFGQHDFFIGYWLTALGIGQKLGFNAALKAASPKAGAVLDWMIASHRKRIVGRINQAPRVNVLEYNYLLVIWRNADIQAAGGTVASLPQTYAAVEAQNGAAPTWDKSVYENGTTDIRDGQALDQIIAGPSILKNQLGQTGADLDSAQATANGWRNQKKSEQTALGAEAGSSWFRYLNAVNNPAIS